MDIELTQTDVQDDSRAVVFLDIDNTLYSASSRIADAMGERIHAYFISLGLSDEEAWDLHRTYYKQYGLALRGLVRHHNVDTLEFDKRCDGSLPLESMLKPDPMVRKVLLDIDRSKARVWALTNAYVTHATRVLKILELDDLIEGLVYCDYSEPDFSCKPDKAFFDIAMKKARATNCAHIYFVDDSRTNVEAALRLGWQSVHFCEAGLSTTEGGVKKPISGVVDSAEGYVSVSTLEGLREVWGEIFKHQ